MKKLTALTLCVLFAVSLLAAPALAGIYMRDPLNSDTFSADGADDTLKFNFKDGGGAWANIRNPYGDSAYVAVEPSEGVVQSMIVTFEITGYDGGDEGYRAMPGFGINGWSPSIWSLDAGGEDNDNWEEVFGEKYNFYIDGDGFYKMIVSFRAAMDWFESENDWYVKDFLEGVDCFELGVFNPPEDTAMRLRLVDLEESENIYSFENIQRPLGSDAFFSADGNFGPLPDPEPPRAPRIDEEDDDDEQPPEETPAAPEETPAPEETSSAPSPEQASPSPASSDDEGGLGWWLWLAIGGGAVAVIIAVVVAKKKK